jgi:hypothetical protein
MLLSKSLCVPAFGVLSRVSRGVPRRAWDTQAVVTIMVIMFSTGKIRVFEKFFVDNIVNLF